MPARGARAVLSHPASQRAFGGDAWVLSLEPGFDPAIAAAAVGADPRVLYAGPNHLLGLDQTLPDDPLADNQYALFQARAFEAWEIADGSGVLIAIVDTGVELDHPDLVNQIAVNEAEAAGLPGVDDDGNGYVDDVRGYDFTDVPGWPGAGDYLERDPDPTDDLGHGTQVAGVAAAERNNGIGMAGMAPGAKLLPVRAGFRTGIPLVSGLLQEDDAAAAILYAVERGARIINLSFGGSVDVPLIRHAVRYARDRGALVVASAGNSGRDDAHYPSACPGLLVAGASNSQGVRAGFSTHGQDLDLLAPGLSLLVTSLGGSFTTSSGTSFSAPMVSGAAALLWSRHPEWSADQVAWRIRLGARRTSPGWTPAQGWGFLDAAAALADDTPPPVLGITSHVGGTDRGLRLDGTVAHPDLLEWSLTAAPDSVAVAAAAGGPMPGERILAEGVTRQAVAESLAVFRPGPEDAGIWVFRLEARLRGFEPLEDRSRTLLPAPAFDLVDLQLEVQADAEGWSLAGWWSSHARYQAAMQLRAPELLDRWREESFLGTYHGIRLGGPLPEGEWTVEVLGRGRETHPYTALGAHAVSVPFAERPELASARAEAYPGTPMPRTIDRNQNGLPEVFLEDPPGRGSYGRVRALEYDGNDFTEWGNSEGLFRGIPIDVADGDGDGRLELIVFRIDRWEVWEASEPGGFPDMPLQQVYAIRSFPSRFVSTPQGLRFLAVDGDVVQLLRPVPPGGYAEETEVDTEGPHLNTRSLPGDFDGDGIDEVAFVDVEGGVVLIELAAEGPRLDHRLPATYRVAASLGKHRQPGGGDDLLVLHQDPAVPDLESDLERASTRLRRWHWTGDAFVETGSLAFAGMHPPGELQIVDAPPGLLLRRGGAFDRVECPDDGSVRWKGRLFTSSLPRVDGAVQVAVSGSEPRVFLGGTSSAEPRSESFTRAPRSPAVERPGPAVLDARPASDRIRLSLGWDASPCGSPELLLREGNVLGSYGIQPRGTRAEDVVAPGETITYRLTSPDCGESRLEIRDARIETVDPRWDGADLRIPLGGPLRPEAAPAASFHVDGAWIPAAATHRLEEDHVLILAGPAGVPDSLRLSGALLESGMPLGGAEPVVVGLPPRPPLIRPAALAEVHYRPQGPLLEVTLTGDPLPCDPGFRLEPGGLLLETAAREATLHLELPAPLSRGIYSLRLEAPCVASAGEGTALTFAVGRLLYPNPVGPGEALTLENLDPGTRITVLDLRGQELRSWTAAGPVERFEVSGLAPGLYLVRLEAPDGATLGIERIGVIR